jgi:hypothetical protein
VLSANRFYFDTILHQQGGQSNHTPAKNIQWFYKEQNILFDGSYHSRRFETVWIQRRNWRIRTYKTIILHVVVYGCETWSLTLRQRNRLRVYKNRVLRIPRPKRDEVTGRWRKVHDKNFHNFYPSPSKIRTIRSRRMRCVGHVQQRGEGENACVISGKAKKEETTRKTKT